MRRSCEDEQAAYLEGEAEAEEHVRTCETCGPFVTELDEIREDLADPALWVEPDPGLEDRVVAAVAEHRATASSAVPPPVSLEDHRRRRQRRAGRPPLLGLAAAAAVVVVALAGGLIVGQAVENRRGPDLKAALAGTELASGARGTAEARIEDNGVEIKLDISGLPTAPPGFFYQAWVKGDKGLVPIGTFHTGKGEVILWSGVPIERYHTVTVTVQEEGGSAASSGKRVLVGELRKGS